MDTLALAVFKLGGRSALVPPPGIGGFGDAVFFNFNNTDGFDFNYQTVIHELGHRIDFKLGSQFDRNVVDQAQTPSGRFLRETGGYDVRGIGGCSDLDGIGWGLCVATSQGIPSGYQIGGIPPTGGVWSSSYAPNNFEDFAQSWMFWILIQAGVFSFDQLDRQRTAFFDNHVSDYFNLERVLKPGHRRKGQ